MSHPLSDGIGLSHNTTLSGLPRPQRRDPINAAEIAFVLEKRRALHASWGAVARMLGRCEADVRAACEHRE